MKYPRIERIEGGYKLGNLVAQGFTPRESQTMLYTATGHSEKEIASAMECSVNNIRQLKRAVVHKLRVKNITAAITKSFADAYLRVASLLIATLIALSAAIPADHHNQIARTGRPRPGSQVRVRVRTRNNGRTQFDGGIYWMPETNELIFS